MSESSIVKQKRRFPIAAIVLLAAILFSVAVSVASSLYSGFLELLIIRQAASLGYVFTAGGSLINAIISLLFGILSFVSLLSLIIFAIMMFPKKKGPLLLLPIILYVAVGILRCAGILVSTVYSLMGTVFQNPFITFSYILSTIPNLVVPPIISILLFLITSAILILIGLIALGKKVSFLAKLEKALWIIAILFIVLLFGFGALGLIGEMLGLLGDILNVIFFNFVPSSMFVLPGLPLMIRLLLYFVSFIISCLSQISTIVYAVAWLFALLDLSSPFKKKKAIESEADAEPIVEADPEADVTNE